MTKRSHVLNTIIVFGALICVPFLARAQDSSEADQLTAAEKTLATDSSDYELLCKASRIAADLAEFETNDQQQTEDFATSAKYARRAIAVNHDSADGHFYLARALGRQALTLGPKGRVHYAIAVKAEADTALKEDSSHAGAFHVLGLWNAEVMRLSGFSRFMAKHVLGGSVLGEANWENAQHDLERAVALQPWRITHHLDLGKVYLDMNMKDKAREEFQKALDLPRKDYNDAHYQDDARKQLAHL